MIVTDSIFSAKQILLTARKRYEQAKVECEKRRTKKGEDYLYHYALMHLGFFSGDYALSFQSFAWLMKGNYLKKKMIDWGIRLFIETPIVRENDYQVAYKRINYLLSSNAIHEDDAKKLRGILLYLAKMALTDVVTTGSLK